MCIRDSPYGTGPAPPAANGCAGAGAAPGSHLQVEEEGEEKEEEEEEKEEEEAPRAPWRQAGRLLTGASAL
eukprot:8249216-Pyramimonas_sp.AAC.1